MRALRVVAAIVALTAITTPAGATSPPDVCAWPARSNPDTGNVAYPDLAANYWVTRFQSVPGARLVIRGAFADARYISFHVYDEAQRPVDGLADVEIDADPGELHHFRDTAAAPGGTYTVQVLFTAKPAAPEPNTLYAGGMQDGSPNPSGAMIYRVYVPTDEDDDTGGVGLPEITFEAPEQSFAVPLAPCQVSTGLHPGLSEVERTSSFPDEAPRPVTAPAATNPPTFQRFYGLDRAAWSRVPSNPVTDPVPRSQGGFLSNEHVAYMTGRLSRNFGDVVAMRFRPPSFPDTRAGSSPAEPTQLRYWSVCENELASQRVIGCLTDFEATTEPDGSVVLVISDPSDRPAGAPNWLPWGGPHYDGLIIYRHMLPSGSFAEAIQNIAEFTDPAATMGAYMPEARYCTKAAFEAGGWEGCAA